MKIRGSIAISTTLSIETGYFGNFEEYIDKLNDIITNNTNDLEKTFKIITSSAEYFIRLYMEYPLDDSTGKFELYTQVETDNFKTEDEWYDKEYDNFIRNEQVKAELEKNCNEYIKEINALIKDIRFPKDENLIFNDGNLYMEISEYTSKHTPEYISLQIDENIDIDKLLDYLC